MLSRVFGRRRDWDILLLAVGAAFDDLVVE